MLSFLARKLPSVLMVALVSSIIAFLLPRLAPGDPAAALAGSDATLEQIEAVRQQMGLDRPIYIQYFDWIGGLFRGDLGQSFVLQRPVTSLIAARLESTIELALLAAFFMIVLGLTLGILAGSPRSRTSRAVLDVMTTAFLAVPPFLTGLILILLLGIAWPVLPISGEVGFLDDPLESLRYLLLPAVSLALPQAAIVARLLQTSMNSVRGEDFVDLAKAKGVGSGAITRRHILPNSLGTAVVALGLRFGDLLAGAIVTEAIFARVGLGQLAVTSVQTRDYPVIQVLIFGAVMIAVIIQLLTEIILAAMDPRVRLEGN